jgi:uncharacterized protein (DUF58 family)
MFTRTVLKHKSLDIDLNLSFPATQVKAKQFLPILLSISSVEEITGLVQIEVSDGLFPVITTETSVINTKRKTDYTFLFYAPKRGKEKIKRISLKFGGLIGFFYLEKRVGLDQEIAVLPEPQRITLPWSQKQKILDQMIAEISTPVKGRGSDFLALRDFLYGDEVKHIHWKASAKFGKLITKEFEEPKILRFLVIVDTSLYMVGPKLEFALSAAIELASLIQKSNHSLSIITHGEKHTKLLKLGNSISAYRKLALDLHNVQAEGTGFDYLALQKYLVDNQLVGSVLIIISDLEQDPNIIKSGMMALKPYYQALFLFACSSPGFGTLALKKVQEETIFNLDQLFYRREVIEPELSRMYVKRAKEYRQAIQGQTSRFRVIENYNTNIALELRSLLTSYPKQSRVITNVGVVEK